MVTVRLMGVLRQAAGTDRIEVPTGVDSDVNAVVQWLTENYVGLRETLVDRVVDSPVPNALILVDGVEVGNLEEEHTPVRRDSTVVFLSVTHGG